jgi:ribose transport system permease protein
MEAPRLGPPSPLASVGHLLRSGGVVLPLLLLCAGFGLINHRFLAPANLQTIVEQSSITVVVGIGLTFVIVMGAIDLSVEGVMAASAVGLTLVVRNPINGNDFGLFGAALAILLGVAFGFFNGVANAYLRIPSFVVTLGTWSIALGLGTVFLFAFALQGEPVIEDRFVRSLAFTNKAGFSTLTFVAIAVAVLGLLVQRFTVLGRRAYAIGGGEETARLSGIPVARCKVAVFTLAGALFGLAGVMTAVRLGVGTLQVGADTLFTSITAVVIGGTPLSGGRGGVLNTVLGAVTLGALANGMVLAGVPPFYQQAVRGVIILVVLTVAALAYRQRLRVVK